MGRTDSKDQKLQPYLMERKRGMDWHLRHFSMSKVHKAHIYSTRNQKVHHVLNINNLI
jgi:hypothetical protein